MSGKRISLPTEGFLLFFQAFEPWERGGPQVPEQVLHVPTLGPEQSHLPHYERVDLHHPSVRFSRDDSPDPGGLTELARTYWPEVDQPGLERNYDMAGCVRIGGHAYVAHNSPEMSVMYELGAQGLLPTPLPAPGYSEEFNRLHQQMEREWFPLAQFGLLDEEYPDTNARFMIRRTDLPQARFDRTICDAEFGG